MDYVLGVDLGTTFTAAAIGRDGRADMVTLGTEGAAIPSLVFLDADGTTLIGEAARRRALSDPGRTAREFKRRLGDPTPLLVGGSPLSADVLMAKLLSAVVASVSAREGRPPSAVAVTHPASWGPYKTDLLRNAARVAGLDGVTLVPEPVAAATQYAATGRLADGAVVAVYDLGGGTFDAAVLRRDGDGFELLGVPEGIERLGGMDFDAAVVSYVDQALGGALAELDPDDDAAGGAAARLHRECIDAKEGLSEDLVADIGVYLPGRTDRVRLTRGEFEQLIRPALVETVAALRRAITSADLTTDQVDAVLLVGGSSRVPLVAEMVGSELGRPVLVDAHPKHTVALGAALLASRTPTPAATTAPPAVVLPPLASVPPAAPAARPASDPGAEPGQALPPGDPAPAGAGRGRSSRLPLVIGGVVVALIVVGAAVLALTGGGGGGGGGGDGSDAAGVELIGFSTAWDGTTCTASWEFGGDAFESGDELWVSADGVVVAKGAALAADSVSGSPRFDSLSLVRDGTVVQRWTPTSAEC